MAGVLLILGAIIAYGQIIPSWIGSLVSGLDPMTGADPSTPSLTDSVGFKFELYYSAQDASDPQNVTNQVISMDTKMAGLIQKCFLIQVKVKQGI